jgi:hypothetical protein
MHSSPAPQASLFKKILTFVLSIGLLIVGLTFSLVLVAVIAVLGLVAWIYFYWKTRAVRKALREAAQDRSIIEGEATVVHEQEAAPGMLIESPAPHNRSTGN